MPKCNHCGAEISPPGEITFDDKYKDVVFGEDRVRMTFSEWQVIKGLRENWGNFVCRKFLADLAFGNAKNANPDCVRVLVLKIRAKIIKFPLRIDTNYGFGYRLSLSDELGPTNRIGVLTDKETFPDFGVVVVENERRRISSSEWRVLEILHKDMGKSVEIKKIMTSVFDDTRSSTYGSARVLISRLRSKLNGSPYRIYNEHDVGYRLERISI